MINLEKYILSILLGLTVSTALFAFTPIPTPPSDACHNDYIPVCGEDTYGNEVTFPNLCKLELESQYNDNITLKHEGTCKSQPTPTPNPLPIELTCDGQPVTTFAQDINVTVPHGGSIYNLSQSASTNHPNVAINPASVRFVDENGEMITRKEVEDVGTWTIGIGGMIIFYPAVDINASGIFTNLEKNSTIFVDYVINNNCDKPKGISNKATLTITIIDPSQSLYHPEEPWFEDSVDSCFWSKPIDAINDIVELKDNEKMKTISVLANDSTYNYSSDFIFASLRLIDNDTNLQRRVYIKNKGTWLADTSSGEVLFIPDEIFSGKATINYAIHSACTSYDKKYTGFSKAKITVIALTPTPTPTPTATPKPVKVPTTQNTPIKVQSSDASALGSLSVLILMIVTWMIGLSGIRRRNV